jgi:plasmid stabilization system protein ParE
VKRAIVDRIFMDCDRLGAFPETGQVGIASGTIQWTVAGLPYIIVYEAGAKKEEIIILGIFYGAQVRS